MQAYQRRRIEAGDCHLCGRPRGEGGKKTICAGCAASTRGHGRRHKQRRRENRLCWDCGAPLAESETTLRCERHREAARETAAKHYRRRGK